MGIHEELQPEMNSDIARRFVAMCAEVWSRYQQPRELLGPVMLAQAINLMLESSEPDEVAHILAGIALSIGVQQNGVGHA